MINTIHAHVIGATRYKMDNGVSGAKISVMQAASADSENALGNQVSIMTANYDITDKIAAQATKYRLPFMHDVPQLAKDGLAVYGPDFEDIFHRAGHYVARILKGEKPAMMPIEEPREFRMIVNMKTAKALGLTLPRAILLRADTVIE